MNGVHTYFAEWVVPITSPPVFEGGLAVAESRIVGLGPAGDVAARFPGAPTTDLGKAIVLPGLVNAHTHLSLTGLPGAPEEGAEFYAGLRQIAAAAGAMSDSDVAAAVRAGIEESVSLGTAAVGEITTRPEGVSELVQDRRLAARVYYEFLGVQEPVARERFATAVERARNLVRSRSRHVRAGLSPHAPFSVWPDLWKKAHDSLGETMRWSTHLAEAPDEDRLLREGTGRAAEALKALGVWDGSFPLPGRGAVEFLDESGLLDSRALLVHGVHLTGEGMELIARSGARVCLCPRSNAYLGLSPPPVSELVARRVSLCLGTDSQASNADLSVWAEMRAVRALAPRLPAREIVRMATVNGAHALGLEDQVGSLSVDAPGRAVAVETTGVEEGDIFEYLVREPVEERLRPL